MSIISKVYNRVLSVIILLFILYANVFFISSLYDIDKEIDEYNYYLEKYDKDIREIDICKIFTCTAINKNNTVYYYDKNLHTYTSISNNSNIHIYDVYYIDINEFSLNIKTNSGFIYVSLVKDLDKTLTILLLSLPLITLIFGFTITTTIIGEQKENIIKTAGNEAMLANKSMIDITENIHHELNTPLEVIDNKIEKIHNQLSAFLLEEYKVTQDIKTIPPDRVKRNRRLAKLNEDFDFIKTSSEQIYAVLEKMKGFKHLRYSNGNKSFGDIVKGSFKIINISNSNFEYKIDDYLYSYRVGKDIKNAEVLSIMLNHIKNSLEATASKIHILFSNFEEDHIYLRIVDNGTGMPGKIKNNLFKANFSSKNSDSGIRGNGMYLNKHILKNVGGDVYLISTSNKGTTLELKIPAIKCSQTILDNKL
jgi:signal transduction histidine kinase